MRQRRLALLAAASVAVLAAAGCGSTSAAVTVDGRSTSRADFEDQLDELYENDEFRLAVFGQQVEAEQLRASDAALGSFGQQFVGAMVMLQVQFAVVDDLLEDEGIDVTDEDREAIESDILSDVPGAFDGVPDDMKRRYLDGFAGFDQLRNEFGEDFEPMVTAAMRDADVEVSSRYGSWNAEQISVDPPAGPRPAPGSEPTDGSQLPAG